MAARYSAAPTARKRWSATKPAAAILRIARKRTKSPASAADPPSSTIRRWSSRADVSIAARTAPAPPRRLDAKLSGQQLAEASGDELGVAGLQGVRVHGELVGPRADVDRRVAGLQLRRQIVRGRAAPIRREPN